MDEKISWEWGKGASIPSLTTTTTIRSLLNGNTHTQTHSQTFPVTWCLVHIKKNYQDITMVPKLGSMPSPVYVCVWGGGVGVVWEDQ